MAFINVVGLSSSDPGPGHFVDVKLGQGPASAGQSEYSAILIGNKLSSGSATADGYVYGSNTPVQCDSEQDVIDLMGAGSELHVAYRVFRAINQSTPLYLLPVTESTGNKAALSVAISGTATAGGSLRVWVGDELIEVGVVSGDTATVVGDNLAAALNGRTYLPATAVNTTGTVAITAQQKGTRGNLLRGQALVTANIGLSVTPANITNFSGGTVDDNWTNALATISGTRYYYYSCACVDATNMGKVTAQIDSMGAPVVGMRQRAVFGSNQPSLSSVQSSAIAMNNARAEVVWQLEGDWVPAQYAAHGAAIYSLFEQALGEEYSLNFNFFGNDNTTSRFWRIPAARSGAKPSRSQLNSALNNGVTPVGAFSNGRTYLVRRVSSKSLNGVVPDYRSRDPHKLTICDRFADDLVNGAFARFGGKVIGDSPKNGQRPPGSVVVTDTVFKAFIFDLINEYANNNLLQNVDAIRASVQVVRESSPRTRMSARVQLQAVDIFNQSATNIEEVGQG